MEDPDVLVDLRLRHKGFFDLFLVFELDTDIFGFDFVHAARFSANHCRKARTSASSSTSARERSAGADEHPDRVGEICKERAALHILFQFRKRDQHFAALHMEMIFEMGDLDFVGRDEVVALEWWKLPRSAAVPRN